MFGVRASKKTEQSRRKSACSSVVLPFVKFVTVGCWFGKFLNKQVMLISIIEISLHLFIYICFTNILKWRISQWKFYQIQNLMMNYFLALKNQQQRSQIFYKYDYLITLIILFSSYPIYKTLPLPKLKTVLLNRMLSSI